jgi:hypothetical protein
MSDPLSCGLRVRTGHSAEHSVFLAYQSVQVSMYHSRNTVSLLLDPGNYSYTAKHIKTDLWSKTIQAPSSTVTIISHYNLILLTFFEQFLCYFAFPIFFSSFKTDLSLHNGSGRSKKDCDLITKKSSHVSTNV